MCFVVILFLNKWKYFCVVLQSRWEIMRFWIEEVMGGIETREKSRMTP